MTLEQYRKEHPYREGQTNYSRNDWEDDTYDEWSDKYITEIPNNNKETYNIRIIGRDATPAELAKALRLIANSIEKIRCNEDALEIDNGEYNDMICNLSISKSS